MGRAGGKEMEGGASLHFTLETGPSSIPFTPDTDSLTGGPRLLGVALGAAHVDPASVPMTLGHRGRRPRQGAPPACGPRGGSPWKARSGGR